MKSTTTRILIFIGILLLALYLSTVLIIGPFYKRVGSSYESLKKNSTQYYYYYSNIDSSDIRDGIFIFKFADSDSLIRYYLTLNDNFEPTANFQGGLIDKNKPLYIIEYFGKDSLIAKVIDSNNCENYVYTPLLHKLKAKE